MPTYEIYTTPNGKQYQFPEGTTPEQAENLIAKADPVEAIRYGIMYEASKEFDLDTGVPELGLRTKLAMSRGNPAEIAGVLNEAVGQGNWGIDGGDIYLTPQGQINAGQEPDKQGRKRMIDSAGLELADFTADIVPELAQGAAAVGASLLTTVPGGQAAGLGILGSLFTRGLMSTSIRAGIGDAAAYIGLEGIQELQGYNTDSLPDILSSAGIQGAMAAGANLVLGAPFAGFAKTAQGIKNNADQFGKLPNLGGVNEEILQAAANVAAKIGEGPADLLSIYTIAKNQASGTMAGQMAARVEGLAIRSDTGSYTARTNDLMSKIVTSMDRELVKGVSPEQAAVKVFNSLEKAEQKLFRDAYSNVKNMNNNPFIQDYANTENIVKFVDYSDNFLRTKMKQQMDILEGKQFYGADVLKDLRFVNVDDQVIADLINNSAKELGTSVEQVIGQFQSYYPKMVADRIAVKNGYAVVSKEKPTLKLGEDIPDSQFARDALAAMNKEVKGPAPVTAYDLLQADKALRSAAYATRDRAITRENLRLSKNLIDRLDDVTPDSQAVKDQLRVSKEAYKQTYADPFFGAKNEKGLFDLITAGTKSTDIESYVKSMVEGNVAGPLVNVIRKMNKLFPDTPAGRASAAAYGLPTANEFIGKMSYMYVRDIHNKMTQELAGAATIADASKIGKKYLKKMLSMRDTVKRRLRGEKEATQVIDALLNTGNVKEYISSLRDIASGLPTRYNNGIAGLKNVLGAKDADQILQKISNAASTYDTNTLKTLAEARTQAQASVNPAAGELYSDAFTTEVYSRLVSSMSIADDIKRFGAMKNWATDLSAAFRNPQNDASLKVILGKNYQPLKEYAYTIQGMLEIEKSSGLVAAQMQTASLIGKLMNLSFSGAVKPLVYMYTMKQFVPGQPGWKALNKALRSGASTDTILKQFAPKTKMFMAAAQRTAELYQSGRAGLVAAAIASQMDNKDMSAPPVIQLPSVPVQTRFNEEKYAAQKQAAQQPQQPDMSSQQQQIGAAIMQMMQAAQQMPKAASVPDVTQALSEGARIGRRA